MSSQNLPYVLKLAGMTITAEANGRPPDDLRKTAERNGVDADQLNRAITILRRHPEQSRTAFVYDQMLLDGQIRGYASLDDRPSPWVLGQLAHGYYDLGNHANQGERSGS